MAGNSTFSALRALVTGKASTPGAGASVPGDDEDETIAPAGDDPAEGDEGEDDAGAGDPPASDPPADNAPADPADAPPAASAPAGRGYEAGVADTNRRWAAMLLDENCRNNLELATSLMVETNLPAAKIASMCQIQGAANPGRSVLATTPKPNLSQTPSSEGAAGADAAASARQSAVAGINARKRGGRAKNEGK